MKQYYYMKTPIKLGDTIEIKGIKVEVTLNLINNNPELFVEEERYIDYVKCIEDYKTPFDKKLFLGRIYKVENDYVKGIYIHSIVGTRLFNPSTLEEFQKQELLEEAKEKYPVGTKISGAAKSESKTIKSQNFRWGTQDNIICDTVEEGDSHYTSCVYFKGTWGEIIEPSLKTEDGVNLYKGDIYWYVWIKENMVNEKLYTPYSCTIKGFKFVSSSDIFRFSTKEAAEEWIKKNKPMNVDKNVIQIKDGDIIDLHQTVNGQNIFVIFNTDPLDIRYAHDLNREYEYDKEDLLRPFKYSGEVEWEIIGNIYSMLLKLVVEKGS